MGDRGGTSEGPTSIGPALDRVLRALGGPTSTELDAIVGGWASAVGPAMADHTEVLAVESGTLVVAVDDPAWASQLGWSQAAVIRSLDAVAPGVVTRVELRVRPGSSPA